MHTVRGVKHGGRLVLVLVGVVAGGIIGPVAARNVAEEVARYATADDRVPHALDSRS